MLSFKSTRIQLLVHKYKAKNHIPKKKIAISPSSCLIKKIKFLQI